MIEDSRIAATILALAGARGAGKSICPTDAAMALAREAALAEWRPLLGPVRRVAARLAQSGAIDVLRKGKPIDPAELKGVIRLRIRPPEGEA